MYCEPPNNHNMFSIIFITLFLAICIVFSQTGCTSESKSALKETLPTSNYYSNCDTCGAHITNWWYVRNDTDSDWCKVCQFCYVDEAMIPIEDF